MRDRGNDDAPALTERRAKDALDELHQIFRCHLDDVWQTQFEVIVEAFFTGRKRAAVAAPVRSVVSTSDNQLHAAFRMLRASLKGVIDISSDMGRVPWYDRIQQPFERHAAAQCRRVCGTKDERSNVEGERGNSAHERGNSACERGNSAHERGKNARARDKADREGGTSRGEAREMEREVGSTRVQRDTIRPERRNVSHQPDWLVR